MGQEFKNVISIIFHNKMNSRDDIKWKLQIIFVYYTSYADRNNFRLLKKQNYRRFLIDSETIKNQSALVYFDIAFQKINNSAIIFKDFLNLIPEIAQLVFKKLGRAQAFKQYILKHIEPLYLEIIQKSQFGQEIFAIMNAPIDQKVQRKLLKIPVTDRAFNEYIAISMHAKEIFQVFESFAGFLKDFEVCPQLVSKSIVYVIFLYLMKDKNQGSSFTIGDFVKALIMIAEIGSRKISTMDLCSSGKMIKLLERMEISVGFERVSKKILYETAISPSFLKSFCDFGQEDQCLEKLDRNITRMYPSSTRHKTCGDTIDFHNQSGKKKQELKTQNLHNVQQLLLDETASFSKDFKDIKVAFEELCEFGQVANSKTLKSFKIKKLFERTGLASLIGQAWLDIQIVNLQRSSESGKIQLPQFLQLLSLVSKKVNLPFDHVIGLVLSDQQAMSRINQNYHQNLFRKTYTQDQEQLLRQIIQSCQKQLQKIYKNYSSDQPIMSFSQLTKMMYQFDIFPTIISKNRLYQIFSTLNDIREESIPSISRRISKGKEVESLLKDSKKIDFSGFLKGLIDISQEICDESLQSGQKLIVLLQKINESIGYKKLSLVSLVGQIRKKFVKYYVKSFQAPEQHIEGFDELLENFA